MRPLPALGEPRSLPRLPVERVTLANGIELIAVERRDLPLIDLEFVLQPGAFRDLPEHAGRISMLAEMLDEGTPTRGTLEIAEELDYLGAHLDVRAGWDAMGLTLHALTGRFPEALDIACDVLAHAAFPEREYVRKQEERLGSLRQEGDEAALLAAKALARGIFGDAHPYGAPLYGTVAAVSRISVDELKCVYQEETRAGKTFAIAVGDFDTPALARALEERLADWPQPVPAAVRPAVVLPPQQSQVLLVDKPGAAQAELRVGHSAPARNTADFFPMIVLNTVLGGSFTSRLNTVLRERMGVTYGASSHFRLRRDGGIFSAGSAVFTESAARSAQVVIEEMQRLIDEPVPAEELRRAQSYMALGLPRQFETSEDVVAHLREEVLHDLPADYWQTYMDRVFAVTTADVAAAAARHLQPASSTVVIAAAAAEVRPALEKARLGMVIDTVVES